jgi:hypothetical protein
MDNKLPFHIALLRLRSVHDKALAALEQMLGEKPLYTVFKWSDTRLSFEAALNVGAGHEGLLLWNRSVSGSIEPDVLKQILDDHVFIHTLEEFRALDCALAELELVDSTDMFSPAGQMGNSGFKFSIQTFCADNAGSVGKSIAARGPAEFGSWCLDPHAASWENRAEVFATALAHYQFRMAQNCQNPTMPPMLLPEHEGEGDLGNDFWGEEQ